MGICLFGSWQLLVSSCLLALGRGGRLRDYGTSMVLIPKLFSISTPMDIPGAWPRRAEANAATQGPPMRLDLSCQRKRSKQESKDYATMLCIQWLTIAPPKSNIFYDFLYRFWSTVHTWFLTANRKAGATFGSISVTYSPLICWTLGRRGSWEATPLYVLNGPATNFFLAML